MTQPCRIAPVLVMLAASACQKAAVAAPGALNDSTYVAVMAELQVIADERIRTPMPPIPIVPGPNGSAPTAEGQRRRDSVIRHRADSIVGVDSIKRGAIFGRFNVTVSDLEATARGLARDPQHVQRVNDVLFKRAASLDSAARLARTRAASPAGAAAPPKKAATPRQ